MIYSKVSVRVTQLLWSPAVICILPLMGSHFIWHKKYYDKSNIIHKYTHLVLRCHAFCMMCEIVSLLCIQWKWKWRNTLMNEWIFGVCASLKTDLPNKTNKSWNYLCFYKRKYSRVKLYMQRIDSNCPFLRRKDRIHTKGKPDRQQLSWKVHNIRCEYEKTHCLTNKITKKWIKYTKQFHSCSSWVKICASQITFEQIISHRWPLTAIQNAIWIFYWILLIYHSIHRTHVEKANRFKYPLHFAYDFWCGFLFSFFAHHLVQSTKCE